jgi:hypothetical protein
MHEPIRDNLEEYLRGSAGKIPQEFQAHLAGCEDCASELRLYQLQAEMLRSLRTENEAEPRAGFYARVMDRIETQGRASMWSALLEPSFGRRLAVACATVVVLLGTYFVATELSEPIVAVAPSIAAVPSVARAVPASLPDAPLPQNAVRANVMREDSVRQQRQRDAVLVNLASFHE